MADHEEWFVNEDGCISVGYPSEAVSYHPTLNAILVTTKEPASVRVLDVTSGLLLQTSHLSGIALSQCDSSSVNITAVVILGNFCLLRCYILFHFAHAHLSR